MKGGDKTRNRRAKELGRYHQPLNEKNKKSKWELNEKKEKRNGKQVERTTRHETKREGKEQRSVITAASRDRLEEKVTAPKISRSTVQHATARSIQDTSLAFLKMI